MPRSAPKTMKDFTNPGSVSHSPEFPDAPPAWSLAEARARARGMGLGLTAEHLEAVRVIQGAYRDEAVPPLRRLHEALEARFAARGGMKYLYGIFSGPPITRICLLAGVNPPPGASDTGFGFSA